MRFLFVNDGSLDTTQNILDALAAMAPEQISCLHLPKNQGKAEAVRQGFLKGFESTPDFIGYFDADLATPLSSIIEFENYFSDASCEIVMGSRVKLLGRRIERNSARHYLGRCFATAASSLLQLPVYDTQCGAKLFRNTSNLRQIFSFPFTVRWIFDVEILARFIMAKQETGQGKCLENTCIEHPLHEWIDRKGSKLKATDFLISLVDLIRICFLLHGRSTGKSYRQKLSLPAKPQT